MLNDDFCSDYSDELSALFDEGSLSREQAAQKAFDDLGSDAVGLVGYGIPELSDAIAELASLKESESIALGVEDLESYQSLRG